MITTPAKFREWLATAKPGSWFPYWTGYLVRDRVTTLDIPGVGKVPGVKSDPAETLASMAWAAYEAGKVCLTQRKVKTAMYEYRAVKR